MALSKIAEAATLIRILLTMFLGLWTAVGPGYRLAAAAKAPPEHPATANPARLGADVQGAGAYAWTFGANLSKWLGPVYLYSNLWYSMSSREPGASPHLAANPLMAPVHGRDLIIPFS